MDDLFEFLEKTGVLTTVGGPISLTIAAFKFIRGNAHDLYYFLPFLQVFSVILGYMALFGWKIETSPALTIFLISFGSIVATAFTTFLMKSFVPSHVYLDQLTKFSDIDRNSLSRLALVWLFFWGVGITTLVLVVYGKECTNPRCMGSELIWGADGYAGSFWIPTFVMCGINTFVLFAVFVAKRRRV